MKIAIKFILLLFHFGIVSLVTYYVGDQISKPINIELIFFVAFIYLFIIVGLISHVKHFILSFKNQIKL